MADSTTVQIQGLLTQFRAGDPTAKTALVAIAEDRLMTLTQQLLRGYPRARNHDDTTGIFQEAYLRLHSSLDELKPATPRLFFGLAALEIRRTLLDIVKKFTGRGKKPRAGQVSLDQEHADGGRIEIPVPDETQKQFDLTEALFQAIDRLPEELKEVVLLLHFQGLTQLQAAEILEVHEATVKRRWNQALVTLADELPEFDPTSFAK